MAHSSTLRRSLAAHRDRATALRAVRPSATSPPSDVQAVHAGDQVEEAVGGIAGQEIALRPSAPARPGSARRGTRGAAHARERAPRSHAVHVSPGAPRALPQCSATLLSTSMAVLNQSSRGTGVDRQSRHVHAHGIGADRTARRARRRRRGKRRGRSSRGQRRALIRRRSLGAPTSSQGLVVSRWCHSHQKTMPLDDGQEEQHDAHVRRLSRGPRRSRRLVLRDEILRRARHAVIIGPAIDDRQFLAPVAVRRRRLRRLPFERRRAPGIAAGVLALERLQTRLNRNTICAAPTISAAIGDEVRSASCADGGMKVVSPSS